MRVNLASDPRVIAVAGLLDRSEHEVVGLLHWLWSWADAHTENGIAVGVSCAWITRMTGVGGFCEALVEVGWLEFTDNAMRIPGFDQHNGTSAKARANGAKRVAKFKAKQKPQPEPVPEEAPKRKKHGKVAPLVDLLSGEFKHLLKGPKSQAVKDWVNHLNQRLSKTYTDIGAARLLKRIDGMTDDDLFRGVEFSIDGNYMKLVIPNNERTNAGKPKRPEEYPE